MNIKYVVLDEIDLVLLRDFDGQAQVFTDKNLARACAEKLICGWQIIEIPFGDES